MSDEAILVVALVGGIAVLCGALLRFQWRKEKRLAARTEIDVPIQSLVRSVLVIVPATVVGPVLGGVFVAATDPWPRQHALAATLGMIGLGVAGMLVGWRASRRYCRVGLLRYTPARLELQYGKARQQIDLEKPYELEEGLGWGPAHMPLQVLYVRQGHIRLGFSYGLPLGRKSYGESAFDRYASPLVDAEARVIHDRLRQQLGR